MSTAIAAPPGLDGLLERESELRRIDALLAQAGAGQGAVAVVEGPPGIGKSRLLDAARARAAGCRVLRARGGELERDYAWGVVRQLLESAIVLAPPGERAALLTGAAAHAAEPLGLAGRTEPVDAGFAAVHGLYWLTVSLAERDPLLLVVDDAQWADVASLRFLAYLGRRVEELPVLLLAGRRTPEPAAAPDPMDGIGPEVVSIEPAPLSPPAVDTLVRAAWPDDAVDDEFYAACHRATGGNPFLLQALVDHLRASGVEPTVDGAQAVADTGPRPVARCLAAMPPPFRALARAVAILGTEVELRHAAALAGLDTTAAGRAADVLAAAHLLRPERPLEFVHPVLRAAVRDDMPAGERSAAHARAARLLADDGADPGRVATHLLSTDAVGDPWRVEMLRDAAGQALGRGAPDFAARLLRRALAESPPADVRSTVLRSLGHAELLAGQDATETLREALAAAEGRVDRATIGRELALALVEPGAYAEAVIVAETAADDARESGDAELALQTEADVATLGKFGRSARERTRARLARLRSRGLEHTPAGRSLLCAMAAEAAMTQPPGSRAVDLANRAIQAGLGPLHLGTSASRFDAAYALTVCDELERADAVVSDAAAQAQAHGWTFKLAVACTFQAHVELRRGRLADAESEARKAIETAAGQRWDLVRMAGGYLAEALVERGELEDAGAAIAAVDGWGELENVLMHNDLLWSRIRVRLARGELEDGLADMRTLVEREALWRRDCPPCVPWRSEAALAHLAAGRRDEAVALAAEELELARAWESPRAIGMAQRALGLARDDEALLRDAVAVLQASPARLEHARALIDLGAWVRRAGRRQEARPPLRQGADLAQRCGATALVDRAMAELRAAGARPRRLVLTGVDALTPSERRVAEMAASGLANREIAQALFVTLRTVEVHLTHAYGKLGIASRAELPGALAR